MTMGEFLKDITCLIELLCLRLHLAITSEYEIIANEGKEPMHL